MVAPPLELATKVSPDGSDPDSRRVATGEPEVVIENVSLLPMVKIADAALVNEVGTSDVVDVVVAAADVVVVLALAVEVVVASGADVVVADANVVEPLTLKEAASHAPAVP